MTVVVSSVYCVSYSPFCLRTHESIPRQSCCRAAQEGLSFLKSQCHFTSPCVMLCTFPVARIYLLSSSSSSMGLPLFFAAMAHLWYISAEAECAPHGLRSWGLLCPHPDAPYSNRYGVGSAGWYCPQPRQLNPPEFVSQTLR